MLPLTKEQRRALYWQVPAAALVLLVLISLPWESADRPVETSLFATAGDPEKAPVLLTAWLPRNRLSPGETVVLRIDARSTRPHGAVRLRLEQMEAPGFERTGSCWVDGIPSCTPGSDGTEEGFQLRAGEARRLEIELRAARSRGSYHVVSVVSVGHSRRPLGAYALDVGPVEVSAAWYRSLRRVATRLYAVAKDLALPMALAALGIIGGYVVGKWEDRRQREAKRQENRRQQAALQQQEERAQAQSTWTKLLERSLIDSQSYYMPLRSKARAFLRVLDGVGDQSGVLHCFHLLSFFRTAEMVRQNIGGFHFKSRLGELVAAESLGLLMYLARDQIGPEDWSKGLRLTPIDERIASFKQRLTPASGENLADGQGPHDAEADAEVNVLHAWMDGVQAWRTAEPSMTDWKGLLVLLFETVGFEANRPLEYWYQEPENEKARVAREFVENCRAAAAGLPESAGPDHDPVLTRLRKHLDLYLGSFEDVGVSHGPEDSTTSSDESSV